MLIARFYCKLVNAWDLSAYAYLVRYAYLQYAYREVLLYQRASRDPPQDLLSSTSNVLA
jgi:hypothetical protein